jgi:hypothetical protein
MRERSVTILGLRKNGEEFAADAAISKLEVGRSRVLIVAVRDFSEQKRIEIEQRLFAEVGSVLATTLEYEETASRCVPPLPLRRVDRRRPSPRSGRSGVPIPDRLGPRVQGAARGAASHAR